MDKVKLVVILILMSTYLLNAQQDSVLIDQRDGQEYKTVKIGAKIWMAENLNFKTDRSWCYANKDENCKTFGRLYYFDAAMEACPAGWHLPSDDEWKELEKELGMPEAELDKYNTWRGTDQATQLFNDSTLGFNILLAGYRNPPSNNMLKGLQAFFWTSTLNNGVAYMRQLRKGSGKIFRRVRPKSWGFSVRCVKD